MGTASIADSYLRLNECGYEYLSMKPECTYEGGYLNKGNATMRNIENVA